MKKLSAIAVIILSIMLLITSCGGDQATKDNHNTDNKAEGQRTNNDSTSVKELEPYIISVMPFENTTGNSDVSWLSTGIMNIIINDLSLIREWQVVDRSNLEKVIKEQKLSRSDLIDDSSARIEIGKILAADTLIIGSFQVIDENIMIVAKIISVETNEVIMSTKIQGMINEIFELQSKVVYNLANDINAYNSGKNMKIAIIDEAVKSRIEEKPTDKSKAIEYYSIANDAYYDQDFTKAEEYVLKAIETDEKYFDALMLANQIYENTNKFDKALDYADKALEYAKTKANEALYYNNTGLLYWKTGKYDKALESHETALKIEKEIYEEKHIDTATSYNNIGLVYGALDNYDKAIEYYNKALAIYQELLGEMNLSTATTYNNIGVAYRKLGFYDEALEYYTKSLSIRKTLLGEKHMDTASSYNNLGVVYWKLNDYNKAIEYYTKALTILEELLEGKHTYIASTYNNIGLIYKDSGEYEKAIEYYKKAAAIFEELLGKNHPSTKTIYHNIASAYEILGNSAKASEYRALAN